MSDKERETYSRIREKLANYECEVPQSCWDGVESGLRRKRRLIRHRRIARWSAAIAAATIFGVLLLFNNNDRTLPVAQYVAENGNADNTKTDTTNIGFNGFESVVAKYDDMADNGHVSDKLSIKAKSEGNAYTEGGLNTGSASSNAVAELKVEDNGNKTVANGGNMGKAYYADNRNTAVMNTGDTCKAEFNEMLKLYKESKPDVQIAGYERKNYSNSAYDNGISISLVAANALNANGRRNRDLSQNNMPLHEELKLYSNEEQLKFKHKMPISAGITVEKRWKNNWGIESGVMYTLLRSTYSTESNTQQGEQELHYVGIPVNVTYRFAQLKMFGFYAAAGPKIDFNVSGKRTESVQNNLAKSNTSENIRDKKQQFSMQLKVGVACSIVKHLELYVEPSLAYYIDNKGDIPNLWEERPLNFVLQFGLRTGF